MEAKVSESSAQGMGGQEELSQTTKLKQGDDQVFEPLEQGTSAAVHLMMSGISKGSSTPEEQSSE